MRRLNPTFRKNSCRKWDILSQTEMNEEYARLEKLSDTELSELMDGMDTDTSAKFVKNLVSRKINEILTTRGAA